jgi:DNA adenine methylase
MGYLGSKAASGAYQAIIALMPVHDTFIDLFVGSGVIVNKKNAAAQTYAVDLDAEAVGRLPDAPGLVKVHGDAFGFLDAFDFGASGRVLVYADPPYLHSTRTSRKRYTHELTDSQHRELLDRLRRIPAAVILSGYPSELYDSLLSDWKSCEFQVMTRGGVRTEKLWFNFVPSHVHWATFAGEDFTDRQRIKRKALRWAENYRALPPGERLAVLAALLEVHHSQS